MVTEMTCWKWFNNVLKEAGVEVTDKNREKIDETIHKYIGKQSSYGRCSTDWRKARKEIQENEEMKQELIEKLRSLV
jgi:predicted Fe-Mo cluster-binding NifX family protein